MKSMWIRRRAAPALVLACAALASCGGGQQVQAFRPTRVIALGDESSVIVDVNADQNGRKYTVNGLLSPTSDPNTLSCQANPIWVQFLATAYRIVFPECNQQPNAVANPTGRIRAQPNAHVADIPTQIDAQVAESPFTSTDFVTVMVGMHDILDQYAQFPSIGEAQLTANLEVAGTTLGLQVNRIADTGAKVLVSTVVDLGITPFAIAEHAANSDTNRAALLQRLTARFNAAMRSSIENNGHKIGLVLADEYFDSVVTIAGGGGFVNVTTPVCDLSQSHQVPPSAFDCTVDTLIPDGNAANYLWADNLLLSAGGHNALGQLVLSRAQNNPF
jgi:phospholipase/lecithinase/hemolysin